MNIPDVDEEILEDMNGYRYKKLMTQMVKSKIDTLNELGHEEIEEMRREDEKDMDFDEKIK